MIDAPHVVLVTSEYVDLHHGGVGTYVELLVAYLRRRFVHLHVVQIPYGNRDPVSERRGSFGEHVIRAPYPNLMLKLDTAYEPRLEPVYRLLPLDQPLVILGNDAHGAYVGGRIKAAARRACLVFVPHGFATIAALHGYAGPQFDEAIATVSPRDVPAIQQDLAVLAAADFVLFISHHLQRYAAEQLGCAPANHAVIRHHIEPPAVARQRYATALRDVVLFGRLELQKGFHDVFEHLEAVLACLPGATLHVYGDGSLGPALKWRSRAAGDRVVWHGHRPRAELLRVLSEMDLAILPSLYEAFPYAALEAMAAGLPVIASDAGGLGEVTAWLPAGLRLRARPGLSPLFGDAARFGLTIPRDELVRTLSYAAANPDAVAEAGRDGARLARELHGGERYAHEMDALFDRIERWLEAR